MGPTVYHDDREPSIRQNSFSDDSISIRSDRGSTDDISYNTKYPLAGSMKSESSLQTIAADTDDDKTDDNSADDTGNAFSFSKLPTRSKYILLLCSMSNFFVCCSFSILAPFFPKEAQMKGLSSTTIGLIFSVFELVIFVTSPIYGNFLTRIGTNFVLVAGICVGGSCSVLFGLLGRSPPGLVFATMCFLCRIMEALAFSAYITASFAILSNEFPRYVTTVIAITKTASGVGMMVGPAVGGALYELYGFGLPFFVMGGLIIVPGVALGVLLPEAAEVKSERKGSVLTPLKNPMVIISIMSIFLCSVGISFLDPTLANHLEPFKLTTAEVGLMFVIGPTLYAIFTPIWGFLVDKKNWVGSLIVIGQFVYGISFLLMGPTPWLPFLPSKLWLIIIGGVLLGISVGCAAVPNIKCLVRGALEVGLEDNLDTYAVVSGLFNSVFHLGSFVGPTVAGVMVEHLGFDLGASIVGSTNIFVSSVAFIFFMRRHCMTKWTQTCDSDEEERRSLLDCQQDDDLCGSIQEEAGDRYRV